MKFIGILGKKRSGKDTTASIICNHFKTYKYELARPIKDVLCRSYTTLKLSEDSGTFLTIEDWNGEGIDREKPLLLSNKQVHNLIIECLSDLMRNHSLRYTFEKDKLNVYFKNNEINTPFYEIIMNNSKPWSIRRLMQLLGTDIVVNLYDTNFWLKLMMNTYFENYGKYDYFLISDIRQPHEYNFAKDINTHMLYIKRDNIETSTDDHSTEKGFDLTDEFIINNNGSFEELNTQIIKFLEKL